MITWSRPKAAKLHSCHRQRELPLPNNEWEHSSLSPLKTQQLSRAGRRRKGKGGRAFSPWAFVYPSEFANVRLSSPKEERRRQHYSFVRFDGGFFLFSLFAPIKRGVKVENRKIAVVRRPCGASVRIFCYSSPYQFLSMLVVYLALIICCLIVQSKLHD